jgi:hypothetical protein
MVCLLKCLSPNERDRAMRYGKEIASSPIGSSAIEPLRRALSASDFFLDFGSGIRKWNIKKKRFVIKIKWICFPKLNKLICI